MADDLLYRNTSNLVRVDGLQDVSGSGDFVNNAAVTFELRDLDGNPIPGGSWPSVCAYVPGTDGRYEGVVPSSLNLDAFDHVINFVIADGGPGKYREWEVRHRVVDPT